MVPFGTNKTSWKENIDKISKTLRAQLDGSNDVTTGEEALIQAAIDAYVAAYPQFEYRFFGKEEFHRKLDVLGMLMDDIREDIDSSLETALEDLFNGMDIGRFTGVETVS